MEGTWKGHSAPGFNLFALFAKCVGFRKTTHSTVKEPKVAKVKSIHYPDHISALETWEMECVVYHGELRELRLLDFGELKNLAGGEDALRDFKPIFGNGNF